MSPPISSAPVIKASMSGLFNVYVWTIGQRSSLTREHTEILGIWSKKGQEIYSLAVKSKPSFPSLSLPDIYWRRWSYLKKKRRRSTRRNSFPSAESKTHNHHLPRNAQCFTENDEIYTDSVFMYPQNSTCLQNMPFIFHLCMMFWFRRVYPCIRFQTTLNQSLIVQWPIFFFFLFEGELMIAIFCGLVFFLADRNWMPAQCGRPRWPNPADLSLANLFCTSWILGSVEVLPNS